MGLLGDQAVADVDRGWVLDVAVRYGAQPGAGVEVRATSEAALAFVGDVVVKLHHRRTRAAELRARLAIAADPALGGSLVSPLRVEPLTAPDGRLASVWPRVDVLAPEDDSFPWAEAGVQLARLHRTAAPACAPQHLPTARMCRAMDRVASCEDEQLARVLRRAAEGVLTGRVPPAPDGETLVHGDWHLGQLGRYAGSRRWRLLDLDDLGVADPAWDLGRPAGFWACGLLDDASWEAFLGGYRTHGGPGVPPEGDPWPRLDLPARAAVVVAAARAASRGPDREWAESQALFEACAGM